jgi:hypothetical protein
MKEEYSVIAAVVIIIIIIIIITTKVHEIHGIPFTFFFLFTNISSSIGSIIVPNFVITEGLINLRCAVSGIQVLPIGARILASKSFTLVKGNGKSLT